MTAATAHDPKGRATYPVLLAVVIILGVLIVLAFVALIVGAILKISSHTASGHATPPAAASLPQGSKIISVEASGDRVIVAVHAPAGDEVDLFDAETGRFVARIRAAPPSPSK